MVAITRDEMELLQMAVIGTCSSHLLLLPGLCFAAGARNGDKADPPFALARSSAQLLLTAFGGLVICMMIAIWLPSGSP